MKISKSPTAAMAFAALLFASGPDAFAAQITISGNGDYRAGSGGEFNVRAADAAGAALLANPLTHYVVNGLIAGTADGTAMKAGASTSLGFETFCMEYNEHISLPGTYNAAISSGSIFGGVAGGVDPDGSGPLPSTDRISVGTAYLYSQFAKGTLAGYTYANGSGRATSAVMLQNAIWYLEDEISLTSAQFSANTFLVAAISLHGTLGAGIGNLAGGAKANNTVYGVAALNLWAGSATSGNQKQDQLIMVPDGGATLMLLGLAMGGLVLLRRKS